MANDMRGDILGRRLMFQMREGFHDSMDFGFQLYIADEGSRVVGQGDPNRIGIAKPMVFEKIEIGLHVDPVLSMKKQEAEALMNELWRVGIRPSNGEGNVGQIGAIKHHLNDMRAIVEKQLKVKLGD